MCGGSYLRSWRLSRRTRLWPGSSTPASSRSSSVMSLGMRHKYGPLYSQGAPHLEVLEPPLRLLGAHPGSILSLLWDFVTLRGQWGS